MEMGKVNNMAPKLLIQLIQVIQSINWKLCLIIMDFVVGPVVMVAMFTMTFILDVLEKTESLWVKIPVSFLIFTMAAYYVARFRKIWKEGTGIGHDNRNKNKKNHEKN